MFNNNLYGPAPLSPSILLVLRFLKIVFECIRAIFEIELANLLSKVC